MLSFRPDHRSNAEQDWRVLGTCTDNADPSTIDICGPFCVPLLPENPLLKADAGVDPSQMKSASLLPSLNTKRTGKDVFSPHNQLRRGPRIQPWMDTKPEILEPSCSFRASLFAPDQMSGQGVGDRPVRSSISS